MEKPEDIITGVDEPLVSVPPPHHKPNGSSMDEDDELQLMEQFMHDPAHDYHKFRYGDTVDGTIMRVDRDGILVNIGTKAEAVVPLREMQSLTA